MNLLGVLLATVLLVAVLGFLSAQANQRNSGVLFWAWIRCAGATVILVIVLITNFALCSTALKRIVGNEPYSVAKHGRDQLGSFFFGADGALVGPLWALALVLASFVAASILISLLRRLADAVLQFDRAPVDRWRDALGSVFWALPCLVVLAFDGYILAFRVAMLLYHDTMEDGLMGLPAIWSLGDMCTMAGSLLVITAIAYPSVILIVERHFGLAWSRLTSLMLGAPQMARVPINDPEPQPANQREPIEGGAALGVQRQDQDGLQPRVQVGQELDEPAMAVRHVPRIDPPNPNGAEEFIAGVPPANS